MSEHEGIRRALRHIVMAPQTEAELQEQIGACLTRAGIEFEREVMTATGPVDFVVGVTVIEIKIKGSSIDVIRQVTRYLDDPRFDAGIIVTTKPFIIPIIDVKTPYKLKPVRVIELWRQFL